MFCDRTFGALFFCNIEGVRNVFTFQILKTMIVMLFSYDFYSLDSAILKGKIETPKVELLTLSCIVCMKTLLSSFFEVQNPVG